MEGKLQHVHQGSRVVGSDGGSIGTVKEVREDHLVVSAGTLLKHDLFVPIDHIADADDDRVTVSVRAGDVTHEGWRFPPNAGFEAAEPVYPEVPDTTMMQAAGYSAGRLSAPEPQGAVRDDGIIDPGELPNADLGGDAPGTVRDDDQPS
jgi:uncharacterized protein DUF2171